DIADVDRLIVDRVGPQPRQLGREVARPGHDAEPVIGQARYGHVGDHPAALVTPLGVDDAPGWTIDVVGAHPLQEPERSRALDRDLAERREVDDPRSLTNGQRLDS